MKRDRLWSALMSAGPWWWAWTWAGRPRRSVRMTAGITALVLAVCGLAALPAAARGPTVERSSTTITYFDDFIFDLCGVVTDTTLSQRVVTKTFPDGSQTVHVNAEFVPDDPRIPSERNAFTDVIAPDGTLTKKGLPIRVYRKGEGTIIRDAGWVRFLEDGLVMRGPHPFLEADPADVYCPS